MSRFAVRIRIQNSLDAIMCKDFLMTLMGNARLWFQSLAAQSIRNFWELAQRLVIVFISCESFTKNSTQLMNVKQKPRVTLLAYLKCFTEKSI